MVFAGGLMRLLFIASDPMEYTGILARSVNPRPARVANVAVDWARSARIGSHDVRLVANGAGPARASTAVVEMALADFRPDAVVSTGFCGALDAGLGIADVVVGTSVVGAGQYPLRSLASGAAHRTGAICSVGHVAQTAVEKARLLHVSGAIAVEMEAAGVAASAQAFGLPVYCVRVVTDLAGEDMANDFSRALRPDGHFDTMLILRGAVRHPWVRLPELIRLRQRCVRAARVLGDFIADCRF
jgi:adenosylhomocysteine nucleosidase